MPNNETPVKYSVLDWNAEVRKAWAEKWNQPETSYEFSNGRKFDLRTGDAAIYVTSPDFE